ncbi:alpha-galactosidase [Dinghuibacter silviterrae]|uniref:Alpha-galactosidase n=1 Tax=Dinghuibacter silviterrae TaxID=1539049 RepID=A0A4R8DHF7_9BACT|nr:alpha-galactosidase [Dinghuibacter silviterrae]TDW96868.1 alpha-galactosidase [Dinghuibacter silviterrae]
MMQKTIVLFLAAVCPFVMDAQVIRVSTHDNLLLLGVGKDSTLRQLYYGPQTPEGGEDPAKGDEAYSTYGKNYTEVALRLTHDDGNTTTYLVYENHSTRQLDSNTEQTEIHLHDSYYPVSVTLFYKAYRKENVIAQWAEVRNGEKGAIKLHDFASGDLSFHETAYYLTSYYGDWASEANMTETQLQPGIRIIDSKLGVRSDQRSNPSFLLALNGKLREDEGQVLGATLAWPGSWQLKFEVGTEGNLNVLCGANPYASDYTLDPGKTFSTPALLHTYSAEGAGEVTRRFHRWARTYGIRNGYGRRDVLLNNWEATYFDFDEQKLTTIIQQAGTMGFDLFLLDDGWFGNKYPRNNDDAGLGDWEVNTHKLPHGIGYLVDQCRANHLKFGIWIEPEMVNPKSELYEQHPDWVITAPHRPLDLQRNQLILDLSNPRVQEYVYQCIDKLLRQNPGISYVKWDCNRYVTNPGSAYLGKDRQGNLFVDYSKALLNIMDRVKKAFPAVTLMACSGGGGRVDYATLPNFMEFWPSDNTDAVDRIKIGWGMEYFFPAIGLASHVSNIPNGITHRSESLKFRFDVAMTGKLGMDLQPMQMSPADKEFARNAIQTYKGIEDVVLHGDLYRLVSPYEEPRAALMYVTEDKKRAVVYSFLIQKTPESVHRNIRLKGLNPDATYRLSELNKGDKGYFGAYEGKSFTGAFLMNEGVRSDFDHDGESTVFEAVAQ